MLEEKLYDKIDEDNDYKYLLKMPMDSVSQENAEKIIQDKNNKEKELEILKSTTIQEIWLKELDELKSHLINCKTLKIKKK
jgi:DNA topoisomerase-2